MRAQGSGIRSVIVNVSFQSVSNIYYLVVRSIYIVIFARIVGVELYGHYVYAQYWYVLILPIATWGMNELLIAEYARTKQEDRGELAGSGLNLRFALTATAALVLMLGAYFLEPDPTLRLLILIYSQGVLVSGLTGWFAACFVAREASRYVLYLSAPFLTLEVLLVIIFAYSGSSLVTIALVQCAIWWLELAFNHVLYRRKFGTLSMRYSARFTRFFLYNGPVLALAAFILSCFGPGLVIAYRYLVDDAGKLGEIAMAVQAFVILGATIKVVSNSALPQLNKASGQSVQRQAFFALIVWKNSLYIGGVIFFLLCYFLEPAVVRLIGPEFASVARIFGHNSWILIPLIIVQGERLILIANRKLSQFLLATLVGLAALASQLGLLTILQRIDATTVFAALGASYSVVAVLILGYVWKQLGSLSFFAVAFPVVLFVVCLLVFFGLIDESPVFAIIGGVAPLLVASVLGFGNIYRRRIEGSTSR